MRRIFCTLLVLLLAASTALASSEAIDLSAMTYEELQALRDAALTALIPHEIVAGEGAVLFDDSGFTVTYYGCHMDGDDLILDLSYQSEEAFDPFEGVLMREDGLYVNGWQCYSSLDEEPCFCLGEGRKVEGRIYGVNKIGIDSVDDVETLEIILKLTEDGIHPPIIARTGLEMMIYPANLSATPAAPEAIDLSSMSQSELRRLVDDVRRAMIAYEYPAKEGEVVYDDQGVKITLMNWRMEDVEIKFDSIVENNSDATISVDLDETAVNGWPKDVSFYAFLEPGKNGKDADSIDYMGESGIATLEDFESFSFKVVVENRNNFETIAVSDLITLPFAYEAPEDGEAADRTIKISAKGLIEQYDANVVALDMKFAGKPLRITGIIHQFDKSIDGGYTLTLGTDSFTTHYVSCSFSSDAASQLALLSKGDEVTVTGVCQGAYSILILMEDCTITTGD